MSRDCLAFLILLESQPPDQKSKNVLQMTSLSRRYSSFLIRKFYSPLFNTKWTHLFLEYLLENYFFFANPFYLVDQGAKVKVGSIRE